MKVTKVISVVLLSVAAWLVFSDLARQGKLDWIISDSFDVRNEGKNNSFRRKDGKVRSSSLGNIKKRREFTNYPEIIAVGKWTDLELSPMGWSTIRPDISKQTTVAIEMKGCVEQLFNDVTPPFTRIFSVKTGKMNGDNKLWFDYASPDATIAPGVAFGRGVIKSGNKIYVAGDTLTIDKNSVTQIGVQGWYGIGTPPMKPCVDNPPMFRLVKLSANTRKE